MQISGFDRSKIIADLYESAELNAVMAKLEPAHLLADLKQEVFVVLLIMPEERLKELFDGGNLPRFIIGTMNQMVRGNRTPFNKTFRPDFVEWQEQKEIPEEEYQPDERKEAKIEKMTAAMATLHFYDREIIEMYADKSCPEIHRATRIPVKSLYKTVKKTIEKIQAQVQ